MATLETLPSDQRAVLTLVLGRGRSYAEIAQLLAIDADAVSGRARAALDVLGPPASVSAPDRERICDYLLGQVPEDDLPAIRRWLAESPGPRAWATAVADALAPLAARPLQPVSSEVEPVSGVEPSPAVVPGPATAPVAAAPVSAEPVAPEPVTPEPVATAPAAPAAPVPEPAPAAANESPTPGPAPKRSSRRGGMAVIVVTAIVIAAVAVILTRHHHASHATASGGVTRTDPATATDPQTSTSATTGTGSSTPIAQINLDPTAAGGSATAIADVLQDGSQREVAIIGQGVPANSAHNSYEVWLYNSQSDAVSLGFVSPGVSSSGRLSAAGLLPSDAGRYRRLVITTETVAKPKAPGPILLSGAVAGL